MASHFEAIGFDFPDEAAFAGLVERVVSEGESRTRADGGTSSLWRDESGASVAVHLDGDGRLACAAPSFAATSRVRARLNGVAADPECPFCSALVVEVLEDGEMVYPLALQLENVDQVLEMELDGREGDLAVAAFAEDVRIWTDERAYDEALDPEVPLASRSLLPTGFFTPEQKRRGFLRRKEPEPIVQPHALVTGLVEDAAIVRNEVSGEEFIHARVATYAVLLDVVLSASEAPEPLAAGNVVQAGSWMMGRLLGEPPEVAG
jgi:hypothetical protein